MPGTAPLPRVPEPERPRPDDHPDAPTHRIAPVPAARGSRTAAAPPAPLRQQARAPRPLRILEGVSGLLGAGLLLLGVLLLVAQLLAPRLVDAADGPRWWVVGLHLGVGIAAEALRGLRRRSPVGIRYLLACLTTAAVAVVLVVTWWR